MNKIFKTLLSPVFTIEDVPDTEKKTSDEDATVNKYVGKPQTNVNTNSQSDFQNTASTEYHPMQTVSSGDTEKYRKHFQEVMKNSNLPGPDYYELSTSLDSLSSVIADIRTRFISAYTVLAASGLTKEKVLSSGQSYLTDLDNDAQKFNGSLQQVREQEVDGQKAQIEANNKKIQELSLQIQQLNTDNMTINQKVLESEQKINSSKAGYELELNNMKKTISDNLAYINQFIQ